MVIEHGTGRGYIDKDNNLKVQGFADKQGEIHGEGIWVKVIAMRTDSKQGIGILSNSPIEQIRSNGMLTNYEWGDIVLFEEQNIEQIPVIIDRVTRIPNTGLWNLSSLRR